MFHHSIRYKIELIDSSDYTYKVALNVRPYFNPGILLGFVLNDGTELESTIVSISDEKTFNVRGQGRLN